MKGERKTIADDQGAALDLTVLNDVVCTDQVYDGRRAYKLNMNNLDEPELPSGYDIMLCDDPTPDLVALLGEDAVVCLDNGQLVFRQVQQGSEPGRYDLRDRFSDSATVTHNVQPRWAAALVCGIAGKHWEKMVGWDHVQSITASLN